MRKSVTELGDRTPGTSGGRQGSHETAEASSAAGRRGARRAILASTIGSAIEWYDFYLYSSASTLVLVPLFFPVHSSGAALLAVFATYAAGFVARPVGGVLIGHFGDRVGRKSMLVLTLIAMGTGTFLVGVLPTYQEAGIWAPVMLVFLRVVQGIGIGGEWGGGVLMSTEHVPPRRRAFASSLPAGGFPLGLAASSLMFSLVALAPRHELLSWVWRLPFLASAVLVAIGIAVRLGVTESPEFLRERASHAVSRLPVAEVFRHRPRRVVQGAVAALGLASIVSVYTVYLPAYANARPSVQPVVLHGLVIGALAEAAMLPVFGILSDRLGRRRVIVFGYAVCALVALPATHWMSSGNATLTTLTFVLAMGVGHAAVYGGFAAFLVDRFPTRYRYSALALTYQLGATVASFIPLVAGAMSGGARSTQPGIALLLGVLLVAAAVVAGSGSDGAAAGSGSDRSGIVPVRQ